MAVVAVLWCSNETRELVTERPVARQVVQTCVQAWEMVGKLQWVAVRKVRCRWWGVGGGGNTG